jgi:hypothetical protein
MAMQKISDYSSQVPFKDFKLVVKSYWFIKPLCATVYICEQEHHHGPVAEDKTFDFVHDIRKPLCINIDMRGKQENYTNEHEDHALDIELYYQQNMILPLHRQGIKYVEPVPYIGFNGVWTYDTEVSWYEHWWNISGKGKIY